MKETDPSDIMPPPPAAALSSEQIAQIGQWIDQGALNNECTSIANCDIENVTFLNNVQPIVQNKCQGCHSGVAPQGGISLSSYIEIKASVNSGRFLGSINHSSGYAAMPPSSAKLPSCDIDQIMRWINDGAPNN